MKQLLLLAITGAALTASAQNWSAPVAVTTGAGDDHHVAAEISYAGICRLIWDRTEAEYTHLFRRDFNVVTGDLEPEICLTYGHCRDEKPRYEPTYGWSDESGVFFQSNREGLYAIYYLDSIGYTGQEPYKFLYSEVNLWEPISRYGGICTPDPYLVFCHSDSHAYSAFFEYELYVFHQSIHLNPAGNYPVLWADGGEEVFPPMYAFTKMSWESMPAGRSEVEYWWSFAYGQAPLQGILTNNTDHARHRPTPYVDGIIFEQETNEGTDFYEVLFNGSGFDDPQPIFQHVGNECNRSDAFDAHNIYAFEQDWNGNWDIAFRSDDDGVTEEVAAHPAQDRNPVLCFSNPLAPSPGYHLFWESNRDGSWKIYYSHRDILGIEPEMEVPLPQSLAVSIHPNPGNAEFRIDLELPVSGEVAAAIFDLCGRRVAKIHDGVVPAGSQKFSWDASDISSGIYLLRVENADNIQTQKMVVLK